MDTTGWIEEAHRIGPALADVAAEHDREGTFVAEGYGALKSGGFAGALVPEDLGGRGGGLRDVCEFIRTLAGYCSSTALAYTMHSHLVAAAVWRHRHGQGGEPMLRRVAAENWVLVSTGANDWLDSNGQLERVDGGYRFTAKKPFASGSPIGDAMVTSGRYDHPEDGPQVLHFALPFAADGVTRGRDWDTLGMRGTGSDTVEIAGAFVPDDAVTITRPRGPWHPAFNVILTVATPIIMSAYVGIAEKAERLALDGAAAKRDDPDVQYLAGELANLVFTARSLWLAQIENAAEYDFAPDLERASRAAQAKTLVADACIAAVDKAMEVAGGQAYFRRSGIERLARDVRAAPYHPLQPKRQHLFTGRVALGLDPV